MSGKSRAAADLLNEVLSLVICLRLHVVSVIVNHLA